ncbi:MXAN_6640 family putative metalloprotease [Nocardioides sp. SYSU DS0663]|uniref:MXAN_6640 family putative metalloprotease n=1 Tax=Nocardioides sp. SYSU DS0663 TaxID=3416445 RepID=UPI003F4CA18D
MRRSLTTAVAALATGLALLPAGSSAAADPTGAAASPSAPVTALEAPEVDVPALEVTEDQAQAALAEATEVVVEGRAPAEHARGGQHVEEAEATLVLRDLFVALPKLRGEERARARAIMARPSDGADNDMDGYTVASQKSCGPRLCVHYVTSTEDRVPSSAWVRKNLRVLTKVWRRQVGKMGYRAPVRDGGHGGTAQFDVYLKDLGAQGMYGYCVPEFRKKGTRTAAGYCVLDNDFSAAQFGAPPARSLRVTAAHEFFHAVQFAYDFTEDRWLLETTATWMEERIADSANDNRQYLPSGQVQSPGKPLDVFENSGFAQYGNWSFWEYLGGRFGNGIVKKVWQRAGAFKGAPDDHSADALRRAVAKKGGGLAKVYAAYAASNTAPARYYPEGAAWPQAPAAREVAVSRADRAAAARLRVNHLAAQTLLVTPDATLRGRKWHLRIVVDAPNRSSSPAVHVLVRKREGVWGREVVRLNRKGKGRVVVPLSSRKVSGVSVTAANASTRYRCGQATDFACRGLPRDDAKRFNVRVKAFKR